jgi:hypothetical protein
MAQGRFEDVAERMRKVAKEDLRMVEASDYLFGYIHPKYVTVGAWEEFFYANWMGKPIFLCIEGGLPQTPLWLFGRLPLKYIYSSVDAALDMLGKIDEGNKEIDCDRWRIFKPEYLHNL